MSIKATVVSEQDIYRLIMEEVNNNDFGVKFEMANIYQTQNNIGDPTSLFIERMAFNTVNGSFDIKETFNEETYRTNLEKFIPTSIGNLGTQFLAHNDIVEANYSPQISFLSQADDNVMLTTVKLAVEQVRTRLIQYTRRFEYKSMNYENEELNNRIINNSKVILASGEIDYGNIFEINGKFYTIYTLTLNIFLTTSGELSNQQEFYFYTNKILDETTNKPKEFKIPVINWHYGKATQTDDFQLIATKNLVKIGRATESKAIPVSKAFALNFLVQIDFDNEYLTLLYDECMQESLDTPIYYIKIITKKYDVATNSYINFRENKRSYELITNAPPEELSLGEKIYHGLVFTPSFDYEWFE